jgi:hypothetical protein
MEEATGGIADLLGGEAADAERARVAASAEPAATASAAPAAATRRSSTRKAATAKKTTAARAGRKKKTASRKTASVRKRGAASKRTASVASRLRASGDGERARDVAAELLKKAGGEMAVADLAAKVVSSGRTRLGGKTPAATVSAQIYTAAKSGVLFKKTGRGKVALLKAKA